MGTVIFFAVLALFIFVGVPLYFYAAWQRGKANAKINRSKNI